MTYCFSTSPSMTYNPKHIYVKYYWLKKNVGNDFLFKILNMRIRRKIFSPKVDKVTFVRISKLICIW